MKALSAAKLQAFEALIGENVALFHRLKAVAEEAHGDGSLTGGEHSVLVSLDQNGPQTVPAMARARPVSRQHIQTLVNALLRKAFVEIMPNPAHRRSHLVRLTVPGRQALLAMRHGERQLLAEVPLGVSKKELRSATATLRAIRETLEGPHWRRLLSEGSGSAGHG